MDGQNRTRDTSLRQLLRLKGEEVVTVDGQALDGKAALTQVVWQLALQGQVNVGGRPLIIQTAREWFTLIKWLFTYLEPNEPSEPDETIIRVVREDLGERYNEETGEIMPPYRSG